MIQLDKERRDRIAAAKAEIAEILDPVKSEQRKARREAARQMRKRVGKRETGQRQPRVHDKPYLAFIRRQACLGCGTTKGVEAAHVRCGYPEAGWRATGMQEKPDDRRTLPLCGECHRTGPKAQHASNERRWWEAQGIYPPSRCADFAALYEGGDLP